MLPGIPKYVGPCTVGCVDVMTQPASKNLASFLPSELCKSNLGTFVRLYYPAIVTEDSKLEEAMWVPELQKRSYINGFLQHSKLSVSIFGWLAYMITRNYTQHALRKASLISEALWKSQAKKPVTSTSKIPVVIFSHGLAGQRTIYSAFCAQLASEGYLVAAVEHRDGSSSYSFTSDCDGNVQDIPYHQLQSGEDEFSLRNMQLEKRADEVNATLDLLQQLNDSPSEIANVLSTDDFDLNCFKGRLDLKNPILAGHSFGGATVLNTLHRSQKFSCGVVFDAWMYPLGKELYENPSPDENQPPILFLFTEAFNWPKNIENLNTYLEASTQGNRDVVTVRGTVHWDQCDIPAVIPSIAYDYSRSKYCKPISFEKCTSVHRTLMSVFLLKYLENRDPSTRLLADGYVLPEGVEIGAKVYKTEPSDD